MYTLDDACMLPELRANLADPGKIVLVQESAAAREAIGEEFSLTPGDNVTGKIYTALRLLGFDGVYDTELNVDLTIFEESTELIHRIFKAIGTPGFKDAGPLPQFTSCCPAWTKYAKNSYSDLLPYLSQAKSPQQITKTYAPVNLGLNPQDVFVISLTPCVTNKPACQCPEIITNRFTEVDAVITTRDLAEMIKEARIDLAELSEGQADSLIGTSHRSTGVFGTEGVTEATLRTVYELLSGQNLNRIEYEAIPGLDDGWETTVEIPVKILDKTVSINACMIRGLKNTDRVINDVLAGQSKYHFIEVVNCPGRCVNSGGQPIKQNLNLGAALNGDLT